MTTTAGAVGQASGRGRRLFGWLLLSASIVLVDQLTKWLILANHRLGDATFLTGFFNIVRAHNSGAAFSFLAGETGWQRWFFTLIGLAAAIFIVWLLREHVGQKLYAFALALLLGGALGNVIDRLQHGYVVDFLDFHWAGWHFPAFNVADSAITIGAICLVWHELRSARSTPS